MKSYFFILLFVFCRLLSAQYPTSYKDDMTPLGEDYQTAYNFAYQEQIDSALFYFEKCASYHLDQGEYRLYLWAQNEFAEYYMAYEQNELAIELLDETSQFIAGKVDTVSEVYINYLYAYLKAYIDLGNYEDARYYLDRRIAICDMLDQPCMGKIDGYLYGSKNYASLGEGLLANRYSDSAFVMMNRYEWVDYLPEYYRAMQYITSKAQLYELSNDYSSYLINNMPIENIDDSLRYAYALYEYASDIYYNAGRFEEALKAFDESLVLLDCFYPVEQYEPLMHYIYALKGALYDESGINADSGMYYMTLALDFAKEKLSEKVIVPMYQNIAYSYSRHDDLDNFQLYADSAAYLLDHMSSAPEYVVRQQAEVYNELYWAQKKYEDALREVLKALAILNGYEADTSDPSFLLRIELEGVDEDLADNVNLMTKYNEALTQLVLQGKDITGQGDLLEYIDHTIELCRQALFSNNSENFSQKMNEYLSTNCSLKAQIILEGGEPQWQQKKDLYILLAQTKALRLSAKMYYDRMLKDGLVSGRDIQGALLASNENQYYKARKALIERKGDVKTEAYAGLIDKIVENNKAIYDVTIKSMYDEVYLDYRSEMISDDLVQNVSNKLGKDDVLVEYFSTDDYFISCYITNDDFGMQVCQRAEIEKLLKKAKRALKSGQQKSTVFAKTYDVLLGHWDKALKGKDRMHVIPDNLMAAFPLEVLVHNNKYLIEEKTISYNYSVELWLKGIEKDVEPEAEMTEVLAIAPVFDVMDMGQGNLLSERTPLYQDSNIFRGNKLISLPGSESEVYRIREILAAKKGFTVNLLLREGAVKANVLEEMQKKNIIHIASHGLVDKNNPYISGIALYPQMAAASPEDVVYHYELYGLDMKADLLVLSACKTAVGRSFEGEGQINLPRGFLFAGVSNVVASLWNVHDAKTADLMSDFYANIAQGKSYAESLRLAKLKSLKEGNVPLDWSGFIITGR